MSGDTWKRLKPHHKRMAEDAAAVVIDMFREDLPPQAQGGATGPAQAVAEVREALDLADQLVGMLDKAHELDWCEDRTLSWREVMIARYRMKRAALASLDTAPAPGVPAEVREGLTVEDYDAIMEEAAALEASDAALAAARQEGAEAMREAAVDRLRSWRADGFNPRSGTYRVLKYVEDILRALPLPEGAAPAPPRR